MVQFPEHIGDTSFDEGSADYIIPLRILLVPLITYR